MIAERTSRQPHLTAQGEEQGKGIGAELGNGLSGEPAKEHGGEQAKGLVGELGRRLGAEGSGRLRGNLRSRHRYRGMALPSALMLASMMLTTSAVWLEASIAHRRYEDNVLEHLRAMQAADGGLTLCERDFRAGLARMLPSLNGAPMQWTRAETFDGLAAYEPIPSWPGSARAPQCVIEAAHVEGNPDAHAYWITARGFGAAQTTQAWVQRMIVREAGRERRAWRRIVTAPTAR